MLKIFDKQTFIYGLVFASIMEFINHSDSLAAFFSIFLFFSVVIKIVRVYGQQLPIRLMFLFFMTFQLFFTAYLAYYTYPDYQFYPMRTTPEIYYGYVIPAVLSFAAGLYYKANRITALEKVNVIEIQKLLVTNPGIAYFFLFVGIGAGYFQTIFGETFAFVMYVLSLLKFVGLFLLLLGNVKMKKGLIAFIYGSIVITSFTTAMFHELIIWTMFLFAVLAIKYKPTIWVKTSFFCLGLLAVLFIQIIKANYRQTLNESDASVEAVVTSTRQVEQESGALFSVSSIAPQISRFNQGWIISSILNTVPEKVPHANGETIKIYFEAALLPRILAPDKLRAGDKEIFNKYSGWQLNEGTAMGLSSIGDAYINYGVIGGCIFMYLYGLGIAFLLNFLGRKSSQYPFLPMFALVIFAYAIRIECEFQTILGHIFKTSFLLYVIFVVYRKGLSRYFVSLPRKLDRKVQTQMIGNKG